MPRPPKRPVLHCFVNTRVLCLAFNKQKKKKKARLLVFVQKESLVSNAVLIKQADTRKRGCVCWYEVISLFLEQQHVCHSCCRALYTYQNQNRGDQVLHSSESALERVGISSATFRQILDYIYTSVILLNDDNIQVLAKLKRFGEESERINLRVQRKKK